MILNALISYGFIFNLLILKEADIILNYKTLI